MNPESRLERVARLASLLLDGTLDPAGADDLNALLKGAPDACERYLDLAEAHASLLYLEGEDRPVGIRTDEGIGAAAVSTAASKRPAKAARRSALRRGWTLALAASLVLLLAGTLWMTGGGRPAPPPPLAEAAGGSAEPQSNRAWVAVLGPSADAVWGGPRARLAEGEALAPGRLSLVSGAAQIEFFSGASVVLEGPAEFELLSAWEMELLSGSLHAFVPEPAQGFAVLTPEFRTVDLGTEFVLSVGGDDGSGVQVIDGEVRLDAFDGASYGHLGAGEGMRVRGGQAEPLNEALSSAIDGSGLLGLAAAAGATRQERWQSAFAALAADPSALVAFDFQGHPAWSRHLENRAAGRLATPAPVPANAAVVGARWTEGRWPGKGALEFKRITDRVRLHLPGEFEALTLAARIRVEGMDRWLSSLLLTDTFEPGQVHWQLSDEGEMILGIHTGEGSPNTFSPPLLRPEDLGRWIHLATTVDRSSGRVVHYLDGQPVAEDLRSGLPPLRLGRAEIGNWSPPEGYAHPIRSLNGRIDEFAVLARALSPDEIRTLSEAGN